MRKLSFLFILLFSCLPIVAAMGDPIIIDELVDLSFKPNNAVIYTSTGNGQIQKFPGVIFPIGEVGQSGNKKTYIIGASLSDLSGEPVTVTFSVFGDNGEEFVTPVRKFVSSPILSSASSSLRESVSKQQKENLEIKSELDREVLNLKKLRFDAAKMSDIGKIIEIEEETKRLRETNQALGRDIDTLKAALQAVKDLSTPARFERRKVLLTEQLSEMAKAALEVEQSASSRKKTSVSDLDRKLSLIESTKFDDLEELEKEYRNITGHDLPETLPETDSIDNSPAPVAEPEVESSEYLNLKEG